MTGYFLYILSSYLITFLIMLLFFGVHFSKLSKIKKKQSEILENEKAS